MTVKSKDDLAKMRKAGLLLWQTHQVAKEMIEAGVTTKAIDREIDSFITSHNAKPLFKGVPGKYPYPAASCTSVNEEVVHGIPSDRKLETGDIISIDIGLQVDGWCSDCACSYGVGKISHEKGKLLETTEKCLAIAIKEMKPGLKWSQIARKMAAHARKNSFTVVEELVGHGIGTEMWESPQVPNYYNRHMPDFRLKQGMVLAVEPMINAGLRHVVTLEDQWTIATRDGKPSAHFEHDIAITAEGCEVLSCGPNGEGWALH